MAAPARTRHAAELPTALALLFCLALPAWLQDQVQQLEAELASSREALQAAQHDREAALAAESAALEQAEAAQAARAAAEERALQHAEERERAEQESARARVDAQRWAVLSHGLAASGQLWRLQAAA